MSDFAAHKEEWDQRYCGYNASNLSTLNVFGSAHCDYVFVDKAHPAIDLMRMNREIMGFDIDTMPMVDGHLFKMSKGLFNSCCEAIMSCVMKWERRCL